ncbi:hypothetical protein SCCGRSA3_02058 [Marine Group I thaumarchaeote SCGC RSA3]|uniref:Uncharacterized protein n=3 Tax=Marine Group I TaxID=905826 RepID=A0A081RL26_9ARCH|nr:hypothetical protein AAA799N04_01694 [Marine Group I thaumarchaeote SCGC AAA799-N04]KFM15627.1 hypothetical protein AAA799D11_01146 [Marine Group I thaumarchaeote SCGC AAA799-D11]KFM16741.1 hypothetical protein SCCGRSA3_02058 [Marine Group I thaumarchaeote SCGC RSA3]
MKTRYKIAIVVSIIIAVGTISTLAYLTQTDFFIVPKRSGNQWSNTELDCPENFIIYENNCVPVNSENREVHDASLFFKSVDGTITELCKIDFEDLGQHKNKLDS